MARYRGPRCKLSRRSGVDLDLTGIRPASSKCKLDTPPGQHGARKGRLSNYAAMLGEKQKLRRVYGILERQFKRFYTIAVRQKGSTAENLIKLLESRLDNVVYRMGFASTRAEARQLVSHRCILVNGKVNNIASYLVKAGDVIEVKEKAKQQLRVKAALESAQLSGFPEWVEVDTKKVSGTFARVPASDDVNVNNIFNVNLVIEYYSR